MAALGRMLQALVVIGFISLLVARELLRAYDTDRSRLAMRRLMLATVSLGVAFFVVIAERLHDLAT